MRIADAPHSCRIVVTSTIPAQNEGGQLDSSIRRTVAAARWSSVRASHAGQSFDTGGHEHSSPPNTAAAARCSASSPIQSRPKPSSCARRLRLQQCKRASCAHVVAPESARREVRPQLAQGYRWRWSHPLASPAGEPTMRRHNDRMISFRIRAAAFWQSVAPTSGVCPPRTLRHTTRETRQRTHSRLSRAPGLQTSDGRSVLIICRRVS